MPTTRWRELLARRRPARAESGAGMKSPFRQRPSSAGGGPAARPAPDIAPPLDRLLRQGAGRLQRLEAVANLPMAAAALVGAVAVALALWELGLAPLAGIALAAGLAFAGWLLRPALLRPDAVTVAHQLDRANDLSDLLASAITVGSADTGMVTEVRRRAIARAAQIAPRSIGSWRLDRGGIAALGLALSLLGLFAAIGIDRGRSPVATADPARTAAAARATPQAEALRAAQAELAAALDPNAPARAVGMDELAQAFADDPATRNAGRALASGDAAGAAGELSELGQRLSRMTPDERAHLQSTLEQVMPAAAGDPLLAGPLQAAAEALAEHRLASAAQALAELGQALQHSQAQLANQAELRSRMEQLGSELGTTAADSSRTSPPTPGSPTTASGRGANPTGSVERIRSDGTIEIVPLRPESDPAALQPRPLELGIDSEPGRNPSAGLLGFAHTAPAPQPPSGFADDRLLRSYVSGPANE